MTKIKTVSGNQGNDLLLDKARYWLLEDVNHALELEDFDYAAQRLVLKLSSWVRAGVIAHVIKLKRLYQQENIKSFKQFCQQVMGRSAASINRQIEAAYVVVALAQAGYEHLPQNEYQARPLVQFAKVNSTPDGYYSCEDNDLLREKWGEVLEKYQPHELSAAKIAEVVDPEFVPLKKPGVRIGSNLQERLIRESSSEGLTPHQLIEQLLDKRDAEKEQAESSKTDADENDYIYPDDLEASPIEPSEREAEEEKVEPIAPEKLDAWLKDVQQLLVEKYGVATTVFNNSS